jgi:transposase
MGPQGSSQAAGFGGIARQGPGGLARSDRDAATTGRCDGAGTGRPHGLWRFDLATKPWAPVPDLVKLEPLTEPLSSYRKMENTDPHPQVTYVGLDVAKDRLDYTVDGIRCDHVPNTAAGHARLAQRLRRVPAARVVCEASGGYEREVVAHLLTAGLEVCVVQPGRVRAFAHAEGLLAKTDRIDACLLRRYGEKMQPRLVVPTTPAAVVLRELLEHRRQLSDQLVATTNRLGLAGATLRPRLERQQTFLQEELAAVDQLIEQHIAGDDDLRGKATRLRELKGVGPVLAATLLAYVPELGQIDSAQLSALIGVAPFARDSGKTSRLRHVRGGRGVVRHVLYMAAVAAIHYNTILAAFYARLRATGKPATVCLVAVMRKMLHVLNRLVADPHFVLAR